MDIPGKVGHTKYAVAETHISGVKADNCDTCIEIVNNVFCIEFQISSSC